MDSIEAKKVIEEEKRKRLEGCQRELNQVLDRYGCVLEAVALLRPNAYPQMMCQLQIKDQQL